ncbi:Fic family protein [Microbacterium maritypicum]
MPDLYRLPQPGFDSPLVPLLFEIERLRADIGTGSTPREVRTELHQLFDTVMSVISARIEGNHTTVYEAVETIGRIATPDDHLREVTNIVDTVRFLDALDPSQPLTHALVRDLHARVVDGLVREGDPTPGAYREVDIAISGSTHAPPSWVTVHADMTDLLQFANEDRPMHEQMMQIALAHHRLVWIHPFRNGNGRVSRLFTYAMLRTKIFATRGYSALNPTAVFGNDRTAYIAALEAADAIDDDGSTTWVTFFARGIRDDLRRLVRLQDHRFVTDELVGPALRMLTADGVIGREEERALQLVLTAGVVKAGDLASALPGSASNRSRTIRSLLDRVLLRQADEGPRFYRLSLSRGPLASRLIRRLNAAGLLPRILRND